MSENENRLNEISHTLTYGKKEERKEAFKEFKKIEMEIKLIRSMFEIGNYWREYQEYEKGGM